MKKAMNFLTPFSYAKLHTLLVILGTTAAAVIDVGIRKQTGELIDLLGDGRIHDFAFSAFGLMIVTYIAISFLLPYVKTRLSDRVQETLYARLYRKALSVSQSALDATDAGTVGTYFTSDTAGIIRYVNRITGMGIPDVFTFLAGSVVLMMIHPWIGVAAILSAVIPVATMTFMSRILVDGHVKYQEATQEINRHIAKHFFNLEFVKASRMEDALERENSNLLLQVLGHKKSVSRKEAILSFPMMLSSFVTILIVALLGGSFVSQDILSVGELFTAITLVDFIVNPVMRFDNTIRQVRRAQANITRLNQYFDMEEADPHLPHATLQQGEVCSLDIRNLTFSYPNGKPVFDGANLSFEAGKLHALVGENGAGKSTLLKLLSGVYAPSAGAISVSLNKTGDSVETCLSDCMVIDTQKAVLFSATIFDNIALGGKLSTEEVRSVCRLVGLDDEISSMAQGYDTKLGGDGSPLSGGQKRRLAFARTLLRKADIYIFDEPTAGVDPDNVRLMIDVLQKLSKKKLVIVITHDPVLIKSADTVTRLEGAL
ncbi:MAG: ABC transporter ATP-binding protein [Clostridia bacterium]|nr:ABC transporter ATP-binding protein [Clostridia bacterium]